MSVGDLKDTWESGMQIAIGGDHAGFFLKEDLLEYVRHLGHEVNHLGAYTFDKDDDYPHFAAAVARSVADGQSDRGIVICGSGVGASVAANKLRGIRASVCHDTYSAHQGVEHDDINVLCLGARVIGIELARDLVNVFLNARFSGGERHQRRLNQVKKLDSTMSNG